MPTLIICSEFISAMGAESIWMPGLNLNDGNAYDYAQRNRIIRAGHNFDEDILASARNIAKRYQCSKSHIRIMENLGLQIFDRMKKVHGLGSRERLLLQIAVILHGCGKYISLSDPADCSYQIIMATEIIGLSEKRAGDHRLHCQVQYHGISVLRGAEPGDRSRPFRISDGGQADGNPSSGQCLRPEPQAEI